MDRRGPIDPANLVGPCRIEGDDADAFWEEFARTIAVDLTKPRPRLYDNGNEPPTTTCSGHHGPWRP